MIISRRKLSNIAIRPNLPLDEVLHVLHTSGVLLHTTVNEHFGLAVVEAMAAGLIPIVHRSGGQWEDILAKSEGLYGFSYGTVEEARMTISSVLDDKEALGAIRRRNKTRVEDFSTSRFRENIQTEIGGIIS